MTGRRAAARRSSYPETNRGNRWTDLNNGYDDFIDQRIVRVNGREFANLQEMIRLIENASDAPFVVFENEKGSRISLERNRVEAEQGEILQTYDIASDRSEDLRTAAVEAPETADKRAELKSPASRP
jgi:hypothetical protein